uniref:Uncharacterized protein n=1 Tax=Rhodothermus marinus TaxID=29549 RepID=A0A7V2B094_RHOMR
MRRALFFSLLFVLGQVGQAQPAQEGVLRVVNWPASEAELARIFARDPGVWGQVEVLPFLDTLLLGYRYLVRGDSVYAAFSLAWHPGLWGLYKGRRVLRAQLPEEIWLERLEVCLGFSVQGRSVACWPVRFDSLALGPWPEVFTSATHAFSVEEVLGAQGRDSLQAWLQAGLQLDTLLLEGLSFSASGKGQATWTTVRTYPEPPFVEVGEGDIVVVVLEGAGKRSVVRGRSQRTGRSRAVRGEKVRGQQPGRETDSRRGQGLIPKGKSQKDDEKDQKEATLLPAALAGIAAVGLVAVAGGGIGYAGNLKQAPIGLTSGVVRSTWGMLLEVSCNAAVLKRSRTEPERLNVRLLVFKGRRSDRWQLGGALGVRWEERGGRYAAYPVLVPALVWRADPLLLIGGVDVVGGGVELSFVLNLRRLKPQ